MFVSAVSSWNSDNLSPERQTLFATAINEVTKAIEEVDAVSIKGFYLDRGTDKMRSVSTPVNKLLLEGLRGFGWETPWRFADLQSQHASFEAGKTFQGPEGTVRLGLDIGSRHAMASLGYFFRGEIATSSLGNGRADCDAVVLLAFTEKTLRWGRWNTAISSYEDFLQQSKLVAPLLSKPIWLLGIDSPQDLHVENRADGTLRLTIKEKP